MTLSIINEIEIPGQNCTLEKIGDFFAAPARLFFGRSYTLETLADGRSILKSPELFPDFCRVLIKIALVVLLPLSLLSTLFGLGLKLLAGQIDPLLNEKYSLPILFNARSEENFSGALPPNPLTPNCVNTQQKSCWGTLYDADPIPIPQDVDDPISALKQCLQSKAELVEERSHYLHYLYTVAIPTGPLKGTYIDDVDIYYNEKQSCFDVRSASRVGFRDAVHFDFTLPGANKKRIEAIRNTFLASVLRAG